MAKKNRFLVIILALFITLLAGCGNKSEDNKTSDKKPGEFGWKDGITAADIPDFPVKGMIDGKEVQFAYINLEKWRGSNDNVLNFSVNKPEQTCGFIDGFTGFTVINKGNSLQGEFTKGKFDDDPKTYQVFFKQGDKKSESKWNSVIAIESITDKQVKGKILIYFNDDKKSWIAGKFEGIVCNN